MNDQKLTKAAQLKNQAWFMKHNPTNFDDIVFPSLDKKLEIKKIIDEGYVQGNMISYGQGGVGKTTINKLIINNIIKNPRDVKVLGRSVSDIDDLKPWLQQPLIASKQKIVVCEEFDLLSGVAQTALKNGLMENFQPKVAFIATTNHIKKIDTALLRRFNIKNDFNSIDYEGVKTRLKQILTIENVNFKEEDADLFVDNHKNLNISDILSAAQICSYSGTFDININTNISGSKNELYISQYINYLVNLMVNARDVNGMFGIITNPKNDKEFYDAYKIISDTICNTLNLNSDIVFELLLKEECLQNLAIKPIILSYYQKLGMVKFADLFLLSLIGDICKACYELKGGSLIQREVPLLG